MRKETLITLAVVVLGTVFTFGGCTDEKNSRKTLENMGFEKIEMTGYDPFTCGDDYTFSTGFKARNPKGVPVTGTVCCGVWKGCSIKF